MTTLILDVMGLSSGTIATLIRKEGIVSPSDYRTLETVHRRFNQFVIGVVASSPKEFASWKEAWRRFADCTDISAIIEGVKR